MYVGALDQRMRLASAHRQRLTNHLPARMKLRTERVTCSLAVAFRNEAGDERPTFHVARSQKMEQVGVRECLENVIIGSSTLHSAVGNLAEPWPYFLRRFFPETIRRHH